MRNCRQSATQNILQHGLSVWKYTFRLTRTDNLSDFCLPAWWDRYKIKIMSNLHDFKTIKHYTIWHDCGKPGVLEIDSDGKKHFPNHANASADVFSKSINNDVKTTRLIRNDMLLHTGKFEDIIHMNLSVKDLCTHIVVTLAELHANAMLFGGINSDSFKIKFKKFEKLAKKLCYQIFDHGYVYVITRNDLSNAQRSVQAIHAAMEVAREFIKPADQHPSLVLCIVKNENKLKNVIKELVDNGIRIKTFREPDLNNSLTAIATEPLIGDKRKVLARFQLLN